MNPMEVMNTAARMGLQCSQHPETGQLMVDGLRWDIWFRLKDQPHRRFVGTRLVKEYN